MAEGAPAAFVSYSREDSRFALKLAEDLKAAGASVWLDELDLIPGEVWDFAVEAAVINCPRMVVILSPASVTSEHVMNEFNFALDEQKIVIPVIHRDCTVPFRLRRLHHVDFRQEYSRGLQELLRAFVPREGARLSGSAIRDAGSERRPNSSDAVQRQVVPEQKRHDATATLFVTVHGGGPTGDAPTSNVRAYDKDGNLITSSVLVESKGVALDQLRGLLLVGRYLYVANASKTENSVLCYEGSGTEYRFVSRFVSNQFCNSIQRPYDVTFDGVGYCYVSSMDTNVVTRLMVSDDGRLGRPARVPAALPPSGAFLSGTFVASSKGHLSNPFTTPVATPAGLAYSAFGEKRRSV